MEQPPNKDLLKCLKQVDSDSILNLFPTYSINKRFLIQYVLEQQSLEHALFEEDPNSQIIFTRESLDIVLESEFQSNKFSKKEILNIFANQNKNLIVDILELSVFDHILIINDIKDYDPESLNVKQDSELSFELLENPSLRQTIRLKYLVTPKGEINLKYLDHMEKCNGFINPVNKVNDDFLRFFLDTETQVLQKITKRFNLKKWLYFILDHHRPLRLNQQEIENLILLNGDFIDAKILVLILNNYYQMEDPGHVWVKKIFTIYDSYFSNNDVAEWYDLDDNANIYNDKCYEEIEEFHRYTFADEKINQFFSTNGIFIRKLVNYSHLVSFLIEKLSAPLNTKKDSKSIISLMIQYLLENRSHPEFQRIACNPEKTLFRIKEYGLKEDMEKGFYSEKMEIALKFRNHDIVATLNELFEARNWDDLADFQAKVREKVIKIDEILDLNLKSMNELLKSAGLPKCFGECSICLGTGKGNLYIVYFCSHFICRPCIENYLKTQGSKIMKINEKNNMLEYVLESKERSSLKCPECKREMVSTQNSILLLKIFGENN